MSQEFGIPDHAAREAMKAAEAERSAREAMKATEAAQSLYESPTSRMMKAIEESPTVRMVRQLEQSPTVQMMRAIEESPAVQMIRRLEESPAAVLSRSIAEQFKPLGIVNPVLGGVLRDGSVISSLAGITALHDWGLNLRRPDYLASSVIATQLGTFAALTDVSRLLVERVNSLDAFARLPAYLQVVPTLESYASASTLHLFLPPGTDVGDIHVIDILAEDLLDGVSDEFEARLASLNQTLLKPVRGAWQTALSNTEDRVRQTAASIRFVVEEMIKQLAPKAQAEAWAQSVGFNKKPPKGAPPVRSAGHWTVQLRFIMRHVDAFAESGEGESVFGYLAEVDLIDMLLLLERLNQAVHEPNAHITEEDLALVLRRVMAFMTLLLDAYEFEAPKR